MAVLLAPVPAVQRVCTPPHSKQIHQRPDAVIIRSDTRSFEGRFAIVTVPPTLASRIIFSPPLPPAREELQQRMIMGCVIKVLRPASAPPPTRLPLWLCFCGTSVPVPQSHVAQVIVIYDRPHWRDAGFSGEAISDTGPMYVSTVPDTQR